MGESRGAQAGGSGKVTSRSLAAAQDAQDSSAMGVCESAICLLHNRQFQYFNGY
jgi:hypothetical protein